MIGGPTPGRHYVVSADPTFTPAERAEINACADAWRDYTEGRLDVSVEDGAGDFRLDRRGPFPGGYEKADRDAWIDADDLYAQGYGAADVRATCENLLGRVFGMQMHAGRGVLSSDDVVVGFTDADRASCVDAGFC